MIQINNAVAIGQKDKENHKILSESAKSKSSNDEEISAKKDEELKGLKDALIKVDDGHKEEKIEKNESKQKYPASLDLKEPLCIESKNRFVLFPIANQEVRFMMSSQ